MKRYINNITLIGLVIGLVFGISGCQSTETKITEDIDKNLTLITYDSYIMDDATKSIFENSTGYKLNIVLSGDGNELASKLRLTKMNPLGDVFYGLDDTNIQNVIDDKVSTHAQVTSKGAVCLNADKEYFKKAKLDYPKSYEDLTKQEYKNLLVIENPISSTPGTVFLYGIIQRFGEGYFQYLNSLFKNGVKVASSWDNAYYNDFTIGSKESSGKGKYPLVLSYSSSPAWTLNDKKTETTTTSLDWSCVQDNEYSGILENSTHPKGAEQLYRFLQSKVYQETIANTIYMYPMIPGMKSGSKEFDKFAKLPNYSQTIDKNLLQNKDKYLKDFQRIMDNN